MKEKYFQLHQWSFSLFSPSNWRSLVFAWMKVWGGSNFSDRNVCIENIKYVCALYKRCFHLHQRIFSFLKPQNTQIFSFLLKSVWDRSKIIVLKKKTFSIIVYSFYHKFHASAWLLQKKTSTAQPNVFSIGLKILAFFSCYYIKFARKFNSDILHKFIFYNEIFRKVFIIRKNLFPTTPVKFLFSNANLREKEREFKSQSFKTKYFRKHFSVERFKHVSVFRKKIFSTA